MGFILCFISALEWNESQRVILNKLIVLGSPQSWISHGGVAGHLLSDPVRLNARQPEELRLGLLPRDLPLAAARTRRSVRQVPAPGAGPARFIQ